MLVEAYYKHNYVNPDKIKIFVDSAFSAEFGLERIII